MLRPSGLRRRISSLLVSAPLARCAALFAVACAVALGTGGSPAWAVDPTPTPTDGGAAQPEITPGKALCSIADTRLDHISGIAAIQGGYVVVEDEDSTNIKIYTLTAACKVNNVDTRSKDPRYIEDAAMGADGNLYLADVGDPDEDRPAVAIWKVPQSGTTATIYRMSYPDGKHSAEAMLLDKNNVPIILTKGSGGVAGIYRPKSALKADIPAPGTAMEKVGEFKPERTDTPNPAGAVGSTIVTGAAVAPDGSKIVIRTLSDAYEFDVTDGDIVKAITSGTYRRTPLPDEPQGEAIAYNADGTKFITVSQKPQGETSAPKLLEYTPFAPAQAEPSGSASPGALPEPGGGASWFDKLTFSELTKIVAAVGAVGLVLAIAGIVGIRRSRARRREEEEYDEYGDYADDRSARGRRATSEGYASLRGEGYGEYEGYGYPEGGYQAAGYGQQYGGGQYDEYGQPYGGGQYAGGQYGDATYGGQQYGGQQYGDPYGQQYGEQQYGDQQYGDQYRDDGSGYYPQGQDDFDPMQDPRRR